MPGLFYAVLVEPDFGRYVFGFQFSVFSPSAFD